MYNGVYFQPSKVRFNWLKKDEPSNQIESKVFKLHQVKPKIPSMTELFKEYGKDLPLLEEKIIQSKCVSHNDILQSKDK